MRDIRKHLCLTTRQVDQMSREIAVSKDNEDYLVSHARLVQIENGESTPSLYKLYSLSAIYGCSINVLLKLYIDVSEIRAQHLKLQHQSTHMLEFDTPEASQRVSFPIRF